MKKTIENALSNLLDVSGIFFLKKIRVYLILSILFVSQLFVVNSGYAQSIDREISFELRNKSLEYGLNELGKLSEFRIAFTLPQVAKYSNITISKGKRTLNETLNLLLANTDLTFAVKNKSILIIKRTGNKQVSKDNAVKQLISGTVLAENSRDSIIGAAIRVKGQTDGTVTDSKGNFSLKVSSFPVTLLVSYVGYKNQEIDVYEADSKTIYLKEDVNKLNEIVVVGYGTQKGSSFTGSIAKIDGSKLAGLSTTSFDQQLAGQASGVQVTVSDGRTNSNPRIRIRGINSINNSRDPLIVVDGLPISTGDIGGYTTTNALADINPNDIASIDVLKDGAASAIYGSRAANGVILITTKHGAKGKMKVTYDAIFSVSNPVNTVKLLNAEQFVLIANEKLTNSGVTTNPAVLDANNTNTDWQSQIYNKNAFSQSHNIGISGATDKTNYLFSLNYLDQQGTIKLNKTNRVGIRATIDQQVNSILKIGTSTSVNKVDNVGVNSSGVSSVVYNSLIALPNVSPYDNTNSTGYNISGDGKSLGAGANLQTIDDTYPNILFSLNNDKYNSQKYRILNTTYGELTLLKNLKIRSQIGVDIEQSNDFYSLDARSGDGYSYNGLVKNTSLNRSVYNFQNYLTYSKTLGKHNLKFVAGNEVQKNTYKTSMAGGSGFSNYFFQTKNLITGSYTTSLSGGSYSEGSFVSYFSRLNYDFAGRYLLGLTVRRDGLSSLSDVNRFGTFPGVSAGWRVSDESFWKGLKETVSTLKVSTSYGKVGNALTGFPYLSTYGASPYASENGINISNVGNSSLTWETSKKYDVKLDAGLLNDRIILNLGWFKNNVDNLVMNVTYPNSFGVPSNTVARNIGAMVNNGIEVSITADAIRSKNFTWNINANFTKVDNKVTQLYNGQSILSTSSEIAVGQALNTLIGYRYAGVNEATGNPMYYKADGRLVQGNIADQKYYYATSKQDGTLGDVTTLTNADKVVLGSPTPTWYGGLTNTFTYKGFSLEAFLRFSGGNKIDNSLERTLLNQKFMNNGVDILNRWTPTNTITDVPKLWYGRESFINLTSSSRWIESGDFLKLQTVTFSYTFNKEQIKNITGGYLSNLRIYAQGQNLFTWTKFKGLDPELISETGTASSTSAPTSRVISLGLNIGF